MRILLSLLLTFVLLLATLWGAGAIWMRLPLGEFGRGAVAALFVAAMLAAMVALWRQQPLLSVALVVPLWAGLSHQALGFAVLAMGVVHVTRTEQAARG